MIIKDFLRRETPGIKLIKSWLFTLNLFFILYALVELFTFLLSPDSGRLSTLVCRPDAQGRSLCTITITGIREIFRTSFLADDYVDTAPTTNFRLTENPFPSSMNLALPWEGVFESDYSTLHDSLDRLVCAVSIKTVDKYIDFVPPYQHETQCGQAEAQVEAAFAGDRAAINIRFDGYSPNIARRAVVLAIAALLLLGQTASRLIRRRRDRKAAAEAEEQKYQLQPERVSSTLIPGGPAAADVTHPHGMSTRKFVLTWWAASVLPIIFWAVLGYLAGGQAPTENCFLSVSDYRSLISITPLSNLLSIAPLVILSTLLAVLQWQVLRMQLRISGWWIAAPLIAGIPMLFWLPTGLKCQVVNSLATPFFMTEPSWNIAGYFLLVGFIQWLVLRRILSYSIGWILIPILCAFVEVYMLYILVLVGMFTLAILGLTRFLEPIVVGISPILLMLDTIISPAAGYYLYRLILARNKLLPDSRASDEVVAG